MSVAPELTMDETDRLIAALGIEIGGDTRTRRLDRRRDARLMAVIRLAPTIEIAEAMLRGERVPVSRLDPEWAKAYGLA